MKIIITFINLLLGVAIVFFERKSPKSVWAWLLLLYFLPVVGFVFYLLLGADMKKRKMFRIKEVEDHISEAIRQQEYHLKSLNVEEFDMNLSNYTDLVLYNLHTSGAVITGDNDIGQVFHTLITPAGIGHPGNFCKDIFTNIRNQRRDSAHLAIPPSIFFVIIAKFQNTVNRKPCPAPFP